MVVNSFLFRWANTCVWLKMPLKPLSRVERVTTDKVQQWTQVKSISTIFIYILLNTTYIHKYFPRVLFRRKKHAVIIACNESRIKPTEVGGNAPLDFKGAGLGPMVIAQ
ncbi:breakpoint cluster region protein [Platysternon megacephalum]|uniref:Breakpoint cluster region protein n=1 Tax=Platysternon megacephalum TaxID=55544 RepID=A0A4D9E002_9SAUR|nr:breakpoint cluster region protein [Platysternon megacephalum]